MTLSKTISPVFLKSVKNNIIHLWALNKNLGIILAFSILSPKSLQNLSTYLCLYCHYLIQCTIIFFLGYCSSSLTSFLASSQTGTVIFRQYKSDDLISSSSFLIFFLVPSNDFWLFSGQSLNGKLASCGLFRIQLCSFVLKKNYS